MTSTQFLQAASKALEVNTLYVKGGWGQLATSKNKAKAIAQYDYNKERKELINNAPYRTFFFDCVCFIKGLLWGWSANFGDSNGGAKYESNGVDDVTCLGLLHMCGNDIFPIEDKTNLKPGCILYFKKGRNSEHVGIYAGRDKVIECAPSLGGVKITHISYQQWQKYGYLECIDYGNTPEPAPVPTYTAGEKIVCNNTPIYVSCDAKKPANHVTGYYWLSDGKNFNGRYRIVNNPMYCGAVNKTIGYINKGDIKCAR